MMNAEDHVVHLKSSKDTDVKHGDVAIFNDYVLNEFDRRALKIEFQDIGDRIVGLYLMKKLRHAVRNISGKYTNAFNPTLYNGERITRDLNACNKE